MRYLRPDDEEPQGPQEDQPQDRLHGLHQEPGLPGGDAGLPRQEAGVPGLSVAEAELTENGEKREEGGKIGTPRGQEARLRVQDDGGSMDRGQEPRLLLVTQAELAENEEKKGEGGKISSKIPEKRSIWKGAETVKLRVAEQKPLDASGNDRRKRN